jgi:hypothetical protein
MTYWPNPLDGSTASNGCKLCGCWKAIPGTIGTGVCKCTDTSILEAQVKVLTEGLEKITSDYGMCGAFICKDSAKEFLDENKEK